MRPTRVGEPNPYLIKTGWVPQPLLIPILIKNHSLMHAEMRGGKDAQNLTQGRREAETQSREEGRGDPSGEALRSIAFYKQTGDKRGAGKRARCSAVKTAFALGRR